MREPQSQMSSDPVLHRILEMLQQRGRTDKELVEHLGLSNGAVTKWKYQKSKSYLTHIAAIADFVGVSPNYLLNGEDDEVNLESITGREVRLLQMFRAIDINGQECIIEAVKRFSELASLGKANTQSN